MSIETAEASTCAWDLRKVRVLRLALFTTLALAIAQSFNWPLSFITPVLVVGASATGLQLAREIHGPDTPVTLSIGEHVRMPRSYRGRDILHWMDSAGILDESIQDMDDINRARGIPSPSWWALVMATWT